MMRIVFQGDSITDAGRSREMDMLPGSGYPTLITAWLTSEKPGKYECLNRGISGDRIVDILKRMRSDIELLKPDVMSLLIGVNDVWHGIEWDNGVPVERFEKVYDLLLDELHASLPELKFMLLEPFVLEGTATRPTEADPERYNRFREGVTARAAVVKRVAEKHNCVFVPLQAQMDALAEQYGSALWLRDGVHPTPAGHAIIAKAWLKAFETIK